MQFWTSSVFYHWYIPSNHIKFLNDNISWLVFHLCLLYASPISAIRPHEQCISYSWYSLWVLNWNEEIWPYLWSWCMYYLDIHVHMFVKIQMGCILKAQSIRRVSIYSLQCSFHGSKVHGANMDPSGADRNQVGPMLAPWTLLSSFLIVAEWCIHLSANYFSVGSDGRFDHISKGHSSWEATM